LWHAELCQLSWLVALLGPDQGSHLGPGGVQADLQALDFTAPAVGLGFADDLAERDRIR
jgi:hypothetical protein